MKKKVYKVYIETSIISFLTGRPSRNLLTAAWQSLTVEWWDNYQDKFSLYASELVIEEAKRGDENASAKRINALKGIPLLELTDSAIKLAKLLLAEDALPHKATDDAFHISLATVHNMDYLLTWNCKHIDNAETKPIIRAIIINNGYNYPEICTPQELLGGDYNEE